jgi:hypothetical protein
MSKKRAGTNSRPFLPESFTRMLHTTSSNSFIILTGVKITEKKGNLPGGPVEFGEVKIEVNTVED